ncbi:unnamed protein product [Clonostachys byssicola]|uniref:Uncharacterized protein n=1 Tax=Clonostachys byssicola TaxID=160290 RepID=A0A9N9UEC2_9HYPO|nr:unnamed protein product [Clonostachys byssicola]
MYQKGKGREVQGYGISTSRTRRGRRGIRSLGPPIAGALRKLWRKERKKTRRLNSSTSCGTTNDKHVDTANNMSPYAAMPREISGFMGDASMSDPTPVEVASNVNLSLTQPGFDNALNGGISANNVPLSEPTQAQSDRLMNHERSDRDSSIVAPVQLNASGAQPVNEPEQVQAEADSREAYRRDYAKQLDELWENGVRAAFEETAETAYLGLDTLVDEEEEEEAENDPYLHLMATTSCGLLGTDLSVAFLPMNQPTQAQSEILANGADHGTGHQSTSHIQPQSRPVTPMSDGGSSVTLCLDEHAHLRSGTPMSDGDSSVTLHTGEPLFRTGTPVSDDMDDDMSDDFDDDIDDDDFEDEEDDEMGNDRWNEFSQVIIEDLWEELRDGKVIRLAVDESAGTSDAMEDADDAQAEKMSDVINEVGDDVNDASDRDGLSDRNSLTLPPIAFITPAQYRAHMLSFESSDVNHMRVPDSAQGQLSGTMDGEDADINSPPLVHPIPLRVQPDFDSVINHVETSADEGDVPRLFINPSLTPADYLRGHLAETMMGYAYGMGISSVHMCYLPEIPRRLEQSVALRNTAYFFCFTWHQFHLGRLQDVDESYGYARASHGIQEELEMVLRFAKYGLADRLVTPELLAALTLTERTLKLFLQGKKAPEYARLCKNLVAELWLVRGPPDLNDPLDTAVSNEIHGLLLREGCEVDVTAIIDSPWDEALALCAVGRPTTVDCPDTDNRPFMINDHIKLLEYTSKLEPLFMDLSRIGRNPYGTKVLAREVQSRLQVIKDAALFTSVCSSSESPKPSENDLRPVAQYFGKRYYLKFVMLAHMFQKMMMHESVPLQVVYEMSYIFSLSPERYLKFFDDAEYDTPEYEVWTRIPQEILDRAEKGAKAIEPWCLKPAPLLAVGVVSDDVPGAGWCSMIWRPLDDRRLLNMPFRDLYKLRLHSSLNDINML